MEGIINEKTKELANNQPKKLTYEQLSEAANQLSQQNKDLVERYKELYKEYERNNYANLHQRMAYLFEIVKNPTVFNPELIKKCVKEITDIITIPEQTQENTSNNNG